MGRDALPLPTIRSAVRRVDLVEGASAAGNGLGLVLQRPVDVRAVACCLASTTLNILRAHRRVEDVRMLFRDVVKCGLWDTEVLGEDILGSVR